ncbi:putative bifunctional UDP-N-acetylglucosamine transferase and deubiquitinase ALG13 [Lampris incognitus]|uniref:putative bifunctional UDP-N-acetylglucosamine transferase and deubiquitinase ALG13 n=1 Tax=Lampris incognitus TaxID=2546036 RepID=UPI0024B59BE6|nr:putative bifunctional UDP-N-acetylglucosamine transferase and deubiquitinase ALG13 [Lampris incognitus]
MQKSPRKYFVSMDEYLSSLGLYRKMMPRDASCLFRVVSEKLYYSQNYHQEVRAECANFMRTNRVTFEPFVEGSFEKYLERLEDPKETAGQVEIKALSLLYRRCFLIYRYPGKPATVITEDDFTDKVILCCSNNGHYDIVYGRNYPSSAALCQSLLYELLYTRVFGVEELDLYQSLEVFRSGGRRYRSSPSACSDGDLGYDAPDDRAHREEWEMSGAGRPAEGQQKASVDDSKPSADSSTPSRLSLPYKVLKSLDGDIYRNLAFDVWQDSRKEMQKTDYMVFAGRQYFLGDKCQVRLEPKGKYYNAFIQEVGTHSSAVTVFIEELGEKHLVPLANLKPVNPVPAWNVAPSRKGDLDGESRGQRRHRYFRKSRGGGGKGTELLIIPSPSYGGRPHPSQNAMPPRFQPATPGRPGIQDYDPYAPPSRSPRYGATRSSGRFLNRHVIGPQLTYYHPGRRYYHSYDNCAFRSRRSRRQFTAAINKPCQFGYSTEAGEESPQDLDGGVAYYQLEEAGDAIYPPLPGQAVAPPPPLMGTPPHPSTSSYWVQQGPITLPLPPPPLPPAPGKPPVTSSEEDQEDSSTMEDHAEYTEEYMYSTREAGLQTPVVHAAPELTTGISQGSQEGNINPPLESINSYNYTQQVRKPPAVIPSSPSSSSSSSPSSSCSHTPPASHLPPQQHSQPRMVAMAIPADAPWLVNELGEPLGPSVAPPPYSYDPNGADLPRDCRVLQYYFNLGVQWYQQSYWQQVYHPPSPPDGLYHYQPYPAYLSPTPNQDMPIHAVPQSFPEPSHGPSLQQAPPYPELGQKGDAPMDAHASGPALALEVSPPCPAPVSSVAANSTAVVYQEQPASLLPLHYESPPPPYLPHPPPPPQQAPYPYHHYVPAHWGAIQGGPASGLHPRVYYPSPNSSHIAGYVAAPPPHFSTTHCIPPNG